MTHPTQTDARKGILLMLLAVVLFTAMDALAKGLVARYPTPQVIWARFAGQAVIVAVVLGPRMGPMLRTAHPWLHVWRSAFQLCATGFFFLALAYIGLPEATRAAKIADGARVWHRMGDLGSLDAEGRLFFFGRRVEKIRAAEGELPTESLEPAFGRLMGPGVDYGDLYFQHSRRESWVVEDGIVKDGSHAIEQGVGVRAVSGEKTGFAYSDDIRAEALLESAAAARAISRDGRAQSAGPRSSIRC